MSATLKTLLSAPDLVIAPGAYDCLTARAVELAGYQAAYMTGAGVSASFGFPDYGLLTMSDMVSVAARMTRSLSIPLIADGDTGYGNELNTALAVREYERAGVAAIQLEDQSFPKKCGHFDNKVIIPADDFIAKIRAASAARSSRDFLIIARTDARPIDGFDAAIERVNRALDAGADIAFVEAPQTMDEIAAVPGRVNGPCLLNVVWRGKTPPVTFAQAKEFGYRLLIMPGLLHKTVMGITEQVLRDAAKQGEHPMPPGDIDIKGGIERAGGAEWRQLQKAIGTN